MPRLNKTEAVIGELSTGRRFTRRPGAGIVKAFVDHLRNTGRPEAFRWLSTTQPNSSVAPIPLTRFSIPSRFRRGLQSRAPCCICSPRHPKFDDGFLVWSSDDGLLRIVGHECGHDYFEDESWAERLSTLEVEEKEAEAKAFLDSTLPVLSSRLVEGWFLRVDIRTLLRFRDELVGGITKRAAQSAVRYSESGSLFVEVDTGTRDDRGNLLVGRQKVVDLPHIAALTARYTHEDLADAAKAAAELWQGAPSEGVPKEEWIPASGILRRLESAVADARKARENLRGILCPDGLRRLSIWGRHSQCPTPFWTEVTADHCFVGKGLKPRTLVGATCLRLPKVDALEPLVVS